MIDLEHFVTKSVHPAAPGSCLFLLIDTKWALCHGDREVRQPGLLCRAGEEAQDRWGVQGVGDRKQRVRNHFSTLSRLFTSSQPVAEY